MNTKLLITITTIAAVAIGIAVSLLIVVHLNENSVTPQDIQNVRNGNTAPYTRARLQQIQEAIK